MYLKNSRIAISLEHPTVGSNALKFGETIVGARVEVNEEQHIENSADDSHSMWRRQHGVQAIEKLPKCLDLYKPTSVKRCWIFPVRFNQLAFRVPTY